MHSDQQARLIREVIPAIYFEAEIAVHQNIPDRCLRLHQRRVGTVESLPPAVTSATATDGVGCRFEVLQRLAQGGGSFTAQFLARDRLTQCVCRDQSVDTIFGTPGFSIPARASALFVGVADGRLEIGGGFSQILGYQIYFGYSVRAGQQAKVETVIVTCDSYIERLAIGQHRYRELTNQSCAVEKQRPR